jgi:hypothetical protein
MGGTLHKLAFLKGIVLFIYLFETIQKNLEATDTAMTAYKHIFENNIET